MKKLLVFILAAMLVCGGILSFLSSKGNGLDLPIYPKVK